MNYVNNGYYLNLCLLHILCEFIFITDSMCYVYYKYSVNLYFIIDAMLIYALIDTMWIYVSYRYMNICLQQILCEIISTIHALITYALTYTMWIYISHR